MYIYRQVYVVYMLTWSECWATCMCLLIVNFLTPDYGQFLMLLTRVLLAYLKFECFVDCWLPSYTLAYISYNSVHMFTIQRRPETYCYLTIYRGKPNWYSTSPYLAVSVIRWFHIIHFYMFTCKIACLASHHVWKNTGKPLMCSEQRTQYIYNGHTDSVVPTGPWKWYLLKRTTSLSQ